MPNLSENEFITTGDVPKVGQALPTGRQARSRIVFQKGLMRRQWFATYFRREWIGLLMLAAVWLTFFSPLIFAGKIYFLDDLKIIYLPLEYLYAQAQHAWELPLWSHEFGFGHPVLSWGQLGFFTPLHVLMRALYIPPLALLQLSVMGYYAIGLLGMYAFLRRFASPQASALGSVVYCFSGFHIGHLNHVNFYTATMLLPWLLLTLHQFFQLSTLRITLLLSLVAALMALSGQPQVVTYSYLIAVIFALCFGIAAGIKQNFEIRWLTRIAGLTLLAAVLAFCLGSFAILPLAEFLPYTDRSSALPIEELYEFSYPPYHAVTLLFPYFFGDHDHYWGAKGFQELAAFVGIIPLMLAGAALMWWRTSGAVRIAAAILLVLSVALALGRHSWLYTWLVESHLLTSIAIPGRFVFFFDVAMAVLSAIGLDTLSQIRKLSPNWRSVLIASLFLFPVLLLTPLFLYLPQDIRVYEQFTAVFKLKNPFVLLTLAGIIAILMYSAFAGRGWQYRQWMKAAVAVIAAATLVIMAWDYNPRVDRSVAQTISPVIPALKDFRKQTGFPARLYAAETILAQAPIDAGTHTTERIGPLFSVHQVLTVPKPGLKCLEVPLRANHSYFGTLRVSLRSALGAEALETQFLPAADITGEHPLALCFESLEKLAGRKVVVSFESDQLTPVELLYTSYTEDAEPAYFVRKEQPTPAQLEASRKPFRLVFQMFYPSPYDREAAFLARHLHVIADASSARWIGALSIGNYRQFIEYFYANDRPAVDGDNMHVVTRYRDIFNMAGITHFIQTLPLGAEDGMLGAGFELVEKHDIGPKEVRLYTNPQALPKAFFVDRAVFKPAADDTRYALQYEPYAPTEVAYISGPIPPSAHLETPATPLGATQAYITRYETTAVDIAVETPREAFLVFSDASTPAWQTYIDDQPAEYYVANSIFKAALVPAGKHTVSFRYNSPAIARSKFLTICGLVAFVALAIFSKVWPRIRRAV